MDYLKSLPSELPSRTPTWRNILSEGRFAFEWLRSRRLGDKVLADLPRGHGEQVMLLPGYGANEKMMSLLSARLEALGYVVRHWGQGKNHGMVHKLQPRVTTLIKQWAQSSGKPVTLVGWSLGGYIAREIARQLKQEVAGVITLGSPAVGGPKYTITASAYRKKGFDLDAIAAEMAKHDGVPIECPLTVLFSKADGIVSWPATIDRLTPHARHLEVHSSHIGMVHDAEVFRQIAQALADQRVG